MKKARRNDMMHPTYTTSDGMPAIYRYTAQNIPHACACACATKEIRGMPRRPVAKKYPPVNINMLPPATMLSNESIE